MLTILFGSLTIPPGHPLNIITRIVYIIPTYGLHLSLENGIILKCVREECPGMNDIVNGSSITIGIGLMIGHSILVTILAYFIESKKSDFFFLKIFIKLWKRIYTAYNSPNPINENEDEDVKNERTAVNNSDKDDSLLLIKNLSTSYDKN